MEITDTFFSISKPGEGKLVEQRSRFLSFAYHVTNEEEINNIIKELHRKFHDARHVCYAYRLSNFENSFRANDDGEPSGTGGRPILGEIDKQNLKDALVAVVRYFGGIKLGTSGLISAYRIAATSALDASIIEKFTIKQKIIIRFGYAEMNDVMKIVSSENVTVSLHEYEGVNCLITLVVPLSQVNQISIRLTKVSGLSIIN